MDNTARRDAGLPYHYDDPAIMDGQLAWQNKLWEYNQTKPTERERRAELLKDMCAEVGDGVHIETPLHASNGCRRVHLGKVIYINAFMSMVDDAEIWIGDYTMFGPSVTIATAGYPILPILREHHYTHALPVHIGRNVWVGSNVSILPGVTIGDGTVIGAGSVVTRSGDKPAANDQSQSPASVLPAVFVNASNVAPRAAGPESRISVSPSESSLSSFPVSGRGLEVRSVLVLRRTRTRQARSGQPGARRAACRVPVGA